MLAGIVCLILLTARLHDMPMPVARILQCMDLEPKHTEWRNIENPATLRRIRREFGISKHLLTTSCDIFFIEGVAVAAIINQVNTPGNNTVYIKRGVDTMFGGIARLSCRVRDVPVVYLKL